MKPYAIVFFSLFLALGGIRLFGQDASGADEFDTSAFDQNVQQSRQEEQANKLEYLFGGTFLLCAQLGARVDTAALVRQLAGAAPVSTRP